MNHRLIPIHRMGESKTHFLDRLEAWKNFAQRITKNPFVQQYLLQTDGHHCAWCAKPILGNCTVHHISYHHYCTYHVTKPIGRPTEKRPNRIRTVPDCESCRHECPERFATCTDKLALVHRSCNKEIADAATAAMAWVHLKGVRGFSPYKHFATAKCNLATY
jgi:hypothetical protein